MASDFDELPPEDGGSLPGRASVRLLLDTHVLLWWLADDPTLGTWARTAISAPESSVHVSAASAWEISIKQAMGKLEAPSDLVRQLELNRFEPFAISVEATFLGGSGLP